MSGPKTIVPGSKLYFLKDILLSIVKYKLELFRKRTHFNLLYLKHVT